MAGVEERNMKIHFGFVLLVLIFGLLLQISATEWCICFTLFGLVLSLELVNTAVEAVVDLVTEEYKPLAKSSHHGSCYRPDHIYPQTPVCSQDSLIKEQSSAGLIS